MVILKGCISLLLCRPDLLSWKYLIYTPQSCILPMSIQLSFLFDALVKPVFVSSHYAIFPCLIYLHMMKKHDHWDDVFPRQRKCVFFNQTYKLKLSNLERKLFIGMVCKKMGEEVDLNTSSFLWKHFLFLFFTDYQLCRTSGKCLTNLVRLRRSPF